MAPPPLHGFDIETDTTVDGLDPATSAIVSAAVVADDGVIHLFDGGEAAIIRGVDELLATLPPGVLVTWNGAGFDLPYTADRAARLGVELALELRLDPALRSHHDPLSGHRGRYRGRWHRHRHLDGYRVFRNDAGYLLPWSCGLKSLARFVGLPIVEVDRTRIHELSPSELSAYVGSDAYLARELVRRRWATARLAVDDPSWVAEAPVR